MRNLIFSLLLLVGVSAKGQSTLLELTNGHQYELSIPFHGDTIVLIPEVNLPVEMGLMRPQRIIEDYRGITEVYYWRGFRIAWHVVYGQRNATTISKL